MEETDHRHRRLLRAHRERPRGRRAAECDPPFPPSDSDCHTPLPCEVRKRKDITPRTCSLAVQGGQNAGCFDLVFGFHCATPRQLLANDDIAASRVAAKPCVGVRSSCCPKARSTARRRSFMMRTAVGASYSGVNRSSTCKLHQTK